MYNRYDDKFLVKLTIKLTIYYTILQIYMY